MQGESFQSASVGYVVGTWPRLSESFILNEILALERQGVPLRIFSVKNPKDEPVHAKVAQVRAEVTYLSLGRNRKVVRQANLRVFCQRPVRYCRTLLRAMRFRRWSAVRRFFQAAYLADILSRQPLARLHAHFANDPTLVTMFAHQLTGIPYAFTAHAKDIYVKTPPNQLRAEAELAQAVITCTDYNQRYLLNRIGPTLNGKLQCIYHGLDLSQFTFFWPRVPVPGPPLILSVARLVEKKGLCDLIAAADILRQKGCCFQIEIVGDGPLRRALATQITQLALDEWVRLLGSQPHEIVRLAYRRASVFALPCIVASDGDRDGIPNVLLEAMGSGIPVVSTPVSGIPELINSERDGLLVPPNNPMLLAEALDRLLGDAELAERLACAARAKIEEQFSVDGGASQLVALFQRMSEQ